MQTVEIYQFAFFHLCKIKQHVAKNQRTFRDQLLRFNILWLSCFTLHFDKYTQTVNFVNAKKFTVTPELSNIRFSLRIEKKKFKTGFWELVNPPQMGKNNKKGTN
jgi:hypothetical protein